jgi:hypothetical protein
MAKPELPEEPVASAAVSRSEATRSQVPDMGPHTTRPTADFILSFLEHVLKTGEPETFATIDLSRPPAWSEPYVLKRFSVDKNKRPNKDMARCAVCSPTNPKCLHKMHLIWYAQEGLIRPVGPDCGDSVGNGDMYAKARQDYDEREELERLYDFIHHNLPKASAMLAALKELRPAIVEAERLHRRLRDDNSDIPKKLRDVFNREGRLLTVNVMVKYEIEEDGNGRRSVTRIGPAGLGRGTDSVTEQFGEVVGVAMFRSKFTALVDVDGYTAIASALPTVRTTNDAFMWMCDQSRDLLEQVREQMRNLTTLSPGS